MTLTQALTAEIARVTAQFNCWARMQRKFPVVQTGLAILSARRAIASGDPVAMKISLEDLKGYGDDD